jgi:hypothetical protein
MIFQSLLGCGEAIGCLNATLKSSKKLIFVLCRHQPTVNAWIGHFEQRATRVTVKSRVESRTSRNASS